MNGNNVTAYGLFVEHYQKYEVIWNGNGGTDIFFQNEMPYDPPSQAAWMEASGVDGWAAFKVTNSVTSFSGYGMGSYSFFNQGVNIYAANAFEVPVTLAPSSLNDLLTVFLNTVRIWWHPQRDRQYRRLIDHRQPGCSGDRGQLPLISKVREQPGQATWLFAEVVNFFYYGC